MSATYPLPTWEHASSRYMCVTHGLIDVLQANFLNGIVLNHDVPHIDWETAAVMVAESLEADRVINLPPKQILFGINQEPESDYKTAQLVEIMFELEKLNQRNTSTEPQRSYRAIAMDSLEKIALTPTASPLLWYEDIYMELADVNQRDDPKKTLDWYKRGLAHSLRFNDGYNGIPFLRDMADVYLDKGELDHGLTMMTALINQSPDDIWIYNQMAITFNRYGLVRLGIQATQRGLQLLDAIGDPESLRSQLEESLETLHTSLNSDREADLSFSVVQAFQGALELEFDTGKHSPIADLCQELVPDLDKIFVKRRLNPLEFPLPDREEVIRYFLLHSTVPAKKKTHRGRRKNRH